MVFTLLLHIKVLAAPVFAAVTGAGIAPDEVDVVVVAEAAVPPLAGTAVCCATGDALMLVERSGVTGAFVLAFATGVLAG